MKKLVLGLALLLPGCAHTIQSERAVAHLYGVVVTVDFPGASAQQYFRWCDPLGYRLFANGFDVLSPILAIPDPLCKNAY